jgi:hypothetical protein
LFIWILATYTPHTPFEILYHKVNITCAKGSHFEVWQHFASQSLPEHSCFIPLVEHSPAVAHRVSNVFDFFAIWLAPHRIARQRVCVLSHVCSVPQSPLPLPLSTHWLHFNWHWTNRENKKTKNKVLFVCVLVLCIQVNMFVVLLWVRVCIHMGQA